MNSLPKWLKSKISTNRELLKLSAISTTIITLLAHAYNFFNLNLNHDFMNEYVTTAVKPWKIVIGRFGNPIINFILGQHLILPWLSGIIMLLSLTIASYLVFKMFVIKKQWQIIALSGFFATSLTFASMIASYMEDLAPDCIAILLSVFSAYSWNRSTKRGKPLWLLISIISLTISLCIYQGFLPLTTCLIIIKSIQRLLKNQPSKSVILNGIKGIIAIGASIILYLLLLKIVEKATGYHLSTTGPNSVTNAWSLDANLLKKIIKTYLYTIWGIFAPSFDAKPGRANLLKPSIRTIQAYSLSTANILLLLISIICIVRIILKRKAKKQNIIISLVLLAILPFTMNIMHFISGTSHILMHYAFVSFYILAFILFKTLPKKWRQATSSIAFILAFILIFNNISIANMLYVRKDLQKQSTQATITRIISRIEEMDEYKHGETRICIIGGNDIQANLPDPGGVSKIFGSDYNSSITYQNSSITYIHYVLQYDANVCFPPELNDIVNNPVFDEMDIYPSKDSIKIINDTIVVKTSAKPRMD